MTNYFVSSGVTSSSITLNSGDEFLVYAGGTAVGTEVNSGGYEYVWGTASGTVVNGFGAQYVYSGGTASGSVVNFQGVQGVYPGGTASGTVVNSDGTDDVGGTASGTVVNIGGLEFVWSSGTDVGTQISGGSQTDYGTVTDATLFGGLQVVEPFGIASGTVMSGGEEVVLGTTVSTVISGGYQVVSAGGTTVGAVVNSGGTEAVLGGTASGTVVNTGGDEIVLAGGTTVSSVANGGTEYVYSGGTASGTTVNSGGSEQVSAGGTTVSTLVNSGSEETVYGTASGTVVNTGGDEIVLAGGTTVSSVANGGTEYVYSGGTASGTTVNTGGDEIVLAGGTASGTVVNNGGYEIIYSGGTASGTVVNNGGYEIIYSGGTEITGSGFQTVAVSVNSTVVDLAQNTTRVSFAFSEAPTAFTLADTTAIGGTLSGLLRVDATDYSATFTATTGIDIANAQVDVTAGSWQEVNGNPGAGATSTAFTVDTTAPTILSLTQNDPSTTIAGAVLYTVTFSEPVTDVNIGDFSLTTSGLSGASVTSVTPVAGGNGAQYNVTVDAGSGSGNVTLNLTGASIRDLDGNGLPGGVFLPAVSYAAGEGPEDGPAIADLTGDGKLDLVVPDVYGDGFSTLLGNGDGTFQSPIFTPTGIGEHEIAIADLNGDGIPDIVDENSNAGTVSVLLGNGDGTFSPASATYSTGYGAGFPVIADLNGDGIPDIVVTNQYAGTVSVLLGNGNGTFQPAINYAGIQPNIVSVADLNGDGKLDLVVSNAGSSMISVFMNNGDGTFQPAINYSADSVGDALVVGDLTGDGRPDIVVPVPNGIAVLLNNGDGTFGAPIIFATPSQPFPFPDAIADVNGDGKADLIITDRATNTASVLLGNGDGTFSGETTYPAGNYPASASVGDFDGSGRPDIAVDDLNGNTVSILLNTPVTVVGPTYTIGQPTLTAPTSVSVTTAAATPIIGISLADTGNVSGETFTVTLKDTNGDLSATGAGVSGAGNTTLTITGSLATVNSDLATLSDTDATTPSDTITLAATDSFGNAAAPRSIAVNVGHTYTLTTGKDTVSGGVGNNTIIAGTNTLSSSDKINGGPGTNTLELVGGGTFNLSLPTTLTGIEFITAQEGEGATAQTVTLRAGLNATVNVASDTAGDTSPTITFFVAAASLSGEIINGGTTGTNTLNVTSGGTATMGTNITGIATVQLATATTFTANATAGLNIIGSTGADKITAGGAGQVLTGGAGADTLTGSSAGGDIFRDTSAGLNGDTIANLLASDVIDITDLASATAVITAYKVTATQTMLTLTDLTNSTKFTLAGADYGSFALAADGTGGTDLTFVPNASLSTFTLPTSTSPVTISAGPVSSVIIATAASLLADDSITGGTGTGVSNQLQLSGGGAFNLAALTKLTNVQTIDAQEGEGATAQMVTLRAGLNATVNVASDTAGDTSPTITIVGAANNTDTINLGTGNDTVMTPGATETVNSGGGNNTFDVAAATLGSVTINGGTTGTNTLNVTGGGTMGTKITGIATVQLMAAATTTNFTANATAGLRISGSAAGGDTITLGAPTQSVVAGGPNETVKASAANADASVSGLGAGSTLEITTGGIIALNATTDVNTVKLDAASTLMLNGMSFITAVGSGGADTIEAGGTYQTLTGLAGADTLIGFTGGFDTFSDKAAGLNGDTIADFLANDTIDITNLAFAGATVSTAASGANTKVTVTSGVTKSVFTLDGAWSSSGFHLASDGVTGTFITHT